MLHFLTWNFVSVNERAHISNVAGSSPKSLLSLIKLNQNLAEKWDHHIPMVNWSDKDPFAYDNNDSLLITSTPKQYARCYIFLEHLSASQDTVRHFCGKSGSREVIFLYKGEYIRYVSGGTGLIGLLNLKKKNHSPRETFHSTVTFSKIYS